MSRTGNIERVIDLMSEAESIFRRQCEGTYEVRKMVLNDMRKIRTALDSLLEDETENEPDMFQEKYYGKLA